MLQAGAEWLQHRNPGSKIWILKGTGWGWTALGVLVLKNNLGSSPMKKQTNMKEEADNPNCEMDQKKKKNPENSYI